MFYFAIRGDIFFFHFCWKVTSKKQSTPYLFLLANRANINKQAYCLALSSLALFKEGQ